jgi:histidinol-phosphatase
VVTLKTEELKRLTRVAEHIAAESRKLILSRLEQGFTHRLKDDGSFVTDVDIAVENLIRSRLAAMAPDHGVLGEEGGGNQEDSELLWVIDPIDGTHSLRHAVPLYGTLLALRSGNRSVLGVIDLPELGKTYVAAEGLGATCNGRTIRLQDVEDESAVRQEIIGIGERRQFVKTDRTTIFDSLMSAHESVRTYCDCFGHALAVAGSVGAMIDYNLRIWDVAATEVIIREAGGTFHQLHDQDAENDPTDRYNVVFGKPTVVRWVLDVIEGTSRREEP